MYISSFYHFFFFFLLFLFKSYHLYQAVTGCAWTKRFLFCHEQWFRNWLALTMKISISVHPYCCRMNYKSCRHLAGRKYGRTFQKVELLHTDSNGGEGSPEQAQRLLQEFPHLHGREHSQYWPGRMSSCSGWNNWCLSLPLLECASLFVELSLLACFSTTINPEVERIHDFYGSLSMQNTK